MVLYIHIHVNSEGKQTLETNPSLSSALQMKVQHVSLTRHHVQIKPSQGLTSLSLLQLKPFETTRQVAEGVACVLEAGLMALAGQQYKG